MNKYNNPRLLNTVVSGTGMKNPVRPHVIIGSEENGFIRGDLMDANAIQELIVTEIAAREHGDEELTLYIDEKVQLAVDDLVDGAPEVLDTLKELSEALGDDANFATTITEEIASKVDKVEGKGLSTNDYTNAEKQKLAGIAAGAEVNVQSDWSLTNSSNDSFIKNKPTKLSQFENDVPYATESELIETKNIVDILYKTDVDLFDILYDDGTVSSDILTPSSGKTPVGICVGIAADFEDGKARFMALKYGSTIYPNGVNLYSQSMGTNMPFLDDELFEDLPLYNYISQDCLRDVNGNLNTDIILNSSNPSKYIAANVCRQFDPGYKVGEWYLPSMGELHLMYSNKVKISAVITELWNAGYNNIAEIDGNIPSMSSTEKDDSYIFSYAPLLTNNPAGAKMKNTRTASGLLVRPFLAITPQCRGKVVDIEKDVDELKENLTFTETTDPANGHEYVEIGGIKWATMNVGATSETDYGLCFAWGETQGYTADQVGTDKRFAWSDYKFNPSGDTKTMTKYNSTDGKTVLDLEDDAARANMGGQWRMPTTEEFQALGNAVDAVWTEDYNGSGVNGFLCTDKTDSSKQLFFPAVGQYGDDSVLNAGSNGIYWSSSLAIDTAWIAAYDLSFYNNYALWSDDYFDRLYGFPVRGVLDGEPETTITPVKEVVTDLKSNEDVIAAALHNLNTKIEATNLRIETFENVTFEDFKGSIDEDVDYFTKFTPNTVGVDDAAGVFNYNVNQLQELVTNNNTEMLLTTTRNNKKLIVGTIRFFTDNFAHQVTAIATSNIHLDEWDKESSLSGVSHTDGKAYTYVCFCGLNDPAAYSGLQEGVWTDWKKLYPTMDDLYEAVNTLKNRQYMDSSTFGAIFTEADSDAIDYIIDNFAPTFYVKGSSNSVVTCSVVRSATAVCVFRNKIDEQTGNAIQDFRSGKIKIDGTIEWSDWTT